MGKEEIVETDLSSRPATLGGMDTAGLQARSTSPCFWVLLLGRAPGAWHMSPCPLRRLCGWHQPLSGILVLAPCWQLSPGFHP